MMEFNFEIEGSDFSKAGTASSEVKKILKQLNLPPALIKRIAVAMYEAEVNIVAHAYKGSMHVAIDPEKVKMVFSDQGPGIPDIDKAMQEGFSTASEEVRQQGFGAGMGLPNIKRNSDKLSINSIVGKGTTVEIVTFIKQ
jgi:serine/threonine-protein kinase RsbT